jgi:hypothetical protein
MDTNTLKIIVERCGRCEHGGLESRYARGVLKDLPTCFHPYHVGEMGGWGSEWAAHCDHFKDTGKVGRIKRTCQNFITSKPPSYR